MGDNFDAFACAPLIREIGRGKDGSRALTREQAATLMSAIFARRVTELELGAVLLALRMKGETAEEVAGFLDGMEDSIKRVKAPDAPVVVIPTYNGARTNANLVPLLAGLLAQRGVPVLMHGQSSEPAAHGIGSNGPRVSTEAILAEMGIAPSISVYDAEDRLVSHRLAYLTLDNVCAPLARLLRLRAVLGVRNVGHTLAKLVVPVAGPGLLLSAYTHPEFGAMLDALFAIRPQAALLMRATEGEAVINVRRAQEVRHWHDGEVETVAERAASAGDGIPDLPERDAASTAAWTLDVLGGRKPAPEALLQQIGYIEQAAARLDRRKQAR